MQIGLEAAKAAATLTGLDGGSLSSMLGSSGSSAATTTTPTPFAELMTDAIGQVNTLEAQAHQAVSGLMTGSGVDVHQAMIATQKSEAAFELALAVRNKAVQAYQSVIGMQF